MENRLKWRREQLGLRPVDVAAHAGCSVSHLHNLEAGLNVPSLALARRLASVLSTTLDELFPQGSGAGAAA